MRLLHEARELGFREVAQIGQNRHVAARSQRLAHPAVEILAAVLPATAVQKHHHWRAFDVVRFVDIQTQAGAVVIDQIVGHLIALGGGEDIEHLLRLAAGQQQRRHQHDH